VARVEGERFALLVLGAGKRHGARDRHRGQKARLVLVFLGGPGAVQRREQAKDRSRSQNCRPHVFPLEVGSSFSTTARSTWQELRGSPALCFSGPPPTARLAWHRSQAGGRWR